ncbi:MAG: histidine phosphatase family protein [Candidatus Woesearchaeota archaeon]
MNITLVRHGETNYTVKGLCSEKAGVNVHLTVKGELQAKLLAKRLKDENFDIIYTSELYRTLQTAEFINEYHNVTHKVDERINDRKTGFDSRPIREFYTFVSKDPIHTRSPGGETLLDVRERVKSFLDDLKTQPHERILIVTHSLVVKLMYVIVNKRPLEDLFAMNVPPAGRVNLSL